MRTRSVIITGMFAAVLAVLSQISIPLPSGVPITLQTFAVALTAYVMGWKRGSGVLLIYILLGAAGVPVFAGFRGGIGHLIGTTGGFLWGFFFMTVLCGWKMNCKRRVVTILYSLAGLFLCHMAGVFQFSVVMETGLYQAMLTVSLPYILKDAISIAGAYMLSLTVRKALHASGEF